MTATVLNMEVLFMQRYLLRSLSATDLPGFLSWLEVAQTAERIAPGLLPDWTPDPATGSWDSAADQIHAEIYSALATPANDPAHCAQAGA